MCRTWWWLPCPACCWTVSSKMHTLCYTFSTSYSWGSSWEVNLLTMDILIIDVIILNSREQFLLSHYFLFFFPWLSFFLVAWMNICSVLRVPYDLAEASLLDSLISKAKFENDRYQKPKRKPRASTEYVDWLWWSLHIHMLNI